jgi:1-acyl-sn-glycerol-3-phosphate acyltransferase
MLYQIAKPLAHVAFSIYFRKIFFSNVQNIPKDKPVILALNHPTAFVEPCIVASFQDRPLNFLARGDFFANPFFAKVLADFNIIPIYRIQDGGYGKLKANYESFKECYQAFSEEKVVLIMAEGGTEHEKRLRPLKKGTARLAFGALDHQPDLDLYIVPVGVNYTKAEEMRHIAMLNFAPPIRIQDYRKIHEEAPAKAIREVTEELKKKLSANVIQIEKGEEDWVDFLLEINRNEWENLHSKEMNDSSKLLKSEVALAEKISNLTPNEKAIFKSQTVDYQHFLNKNNLQDLGFVAHNFADLTNKLILLFISPMALIGFLLNWLPMWLAGKAAKSLIPNDLTFEIPIKITLAIVFYAVYLMIFLVIGLIKGVYLWLPLIFVIPISGWFYLKSKYYFNLTWQAQKVKNLPVNIFEEIQQKRKQLLQKCE